MANQSFYSEKELLELIARDHEPAFKQLYDQFYSDLYYFAESLISNAVQSQDIVITAFTHLWDRRKGFTALSSVKGFLYITVKNGCLKYLQQLTTRARHQQQILQELETSANIVESRIIEAEVLRQLHQRINELSLNYREVIRLLFIEELSIAEAAQYLDITPANLRKRKERALEQLKIQLVKDSLYPLALYYLFTASH